VTRSRSSGATAARPLHETVADDRCPIEGGVLGLEVRYDRENRTGPADRDSGSDRWGDPAIRQGNVSLTFSLWRTLDHHQVRERCIPIDPLETELYIHSLTFSLWRTLDHHQAIAWCDLLPAIAGRAHGV
jgi:hypothetical protein